MCILFISVYLSKNTIWREIPPLNLPQNFPFSSLRILLWCLLLIYFFSLFNPSIRNIPSFVKVINPAKGGTTPPAPDRVYSNNGNLPLVEMLDKECTRVLDIGCGAGDNAVLIKSETLNVMYSVLLIQKPRPNLHKAI